MRTHVIAAVVLVGCAGAPVQTVGGSTPEVEQRPVVFARRSDAGHARSNDRTLDELVAAGRYTRHSTKGGPIHVWIPDGFRRKRAVTIVYVHGLYTDVDRAWAEHRLARQFAASAINAMFIACEAPVRGDDPVSWTSLQELLETVETELGMPLPENRVIAVGHSGAWKTLVHWLGEPALDTVVLLDAVYGEVERYRDWVQASDTRRLIVVGDKSTRRWTEELIAQLPDALVLDSFPPIDERVPRAVRRSPIVYIRSEIGHFPIITGGVALPLTLRTLRGKLLFDAPLADVLESP